VNLLILPTDLIDMIAHVAMGALTLLALAPGEAFYNWGKDEEAKSNRFTAIGGLTNFGYALKHLFEAIPRTILGVVDPKEAEFFFQTKAQIASRVPSEENEEFLF
jgi:hypothetical protein